MDIQLKVSFELSDYHWSFITLAVDLTSRVRNGVQKNGFIEGKSFSLQVLRRMIIIACKYCHTWNTLGQWVRPLAVELAGGGGFVDASKTGVFVLLVARLAMIRCCRGWWRGLATVNLSQAKLTHSKH